MRVDPEDVRRHYELLSDEALLDIDRFELAPMAQAIYDQEVSRRGLKIPTEQRQEEEDDENGDYRLRPVFKPAAAWDSVVEATVSAGDSPPPDWLEDAACPWSAYIDSSADYVGTGAEVEAALREAAIPSRIVVKPPDRDLAKPRSLYCVMVPGDLGTRAYAVLERNLFNRLAVAEWKSQLQSFSDAQLLALDPEDHWGALLDKAKRMKQAYVEEIARRKL